MKKSQSFFFAAVVAAVFSSTPSAHAQMAAQVADQESTGEFAPKSLNINGEVGMPLNPTAQIPDEKEVRVQGNYFDIGRVKNTFSPLLLSSDSEVSLAALPPAGFSQSKDIGKFKYYGLFAAAHAAERLEISGGVARLDARGGTLSSFFNPGGGGGILDRISVPPTGSGQFLTVDYPDMDKTSFALGAKYLVKPATSANDVAVAVGVGYNGALSDNYHGYVVASKRFGEGSRRVVGHLGVRYDHYRLRARLTQTDFSGGASSSNSQNFSAKSGKVSAFVGAEVPLSDSFSVVGEIQSKNTNFRDNDGFFGSGGTPYSLSLRYAKDKVNASIGVQRLGVIKSNGLLAQLGFAF